MMEDETRNKHGVHVECADIFQQWIWDDQDAVTNISAKAVRLFLTEVADGCAFYIRPEDYGGRIVLVALNGELHIEADMGAILRDCARNERWRGSEKQDLKRLLQEVVSLL